MKLSLATNKVVLEVHQTASLCLIIFIIYGLCSMASVMNFLHRIDLTEEFKWADLRDE